MRSSVCTDAQYLQASDIAMNLTSSAKLNETKVWSKCGSYLGNMKVKQADNGEVFPVYQFPYAGDAKMSFILIN